MDIERLKELKGITEQLYQDGNVPLTYCDDVLKLIDEDMERGRGMNELRKCPFCQTEMTPDIAFIEKMFYEYKKLEDRFNESEIEDAIETWNRRIE